MTKFITLSGDAVAQVCEGLGIDIGRDTVGYQAQYRGKVITLAVWMKEAVSLERFVQEGEREFNSDLVITQVRPATRREVTVLVTGLHFNTPDTQVVDYITQFGGKVTSTEAAYGVFRDGPSKGKHNGERIYKAEFTNQITPMGTYHLLGGAKIRVIY